MDPDPAVHVLRSFYIESDSSSSMLSSDSSSPSSRLSSSSYSTAAEHYPVIDTQTPPPVILLAGSSPPTGDTNSFSRTSHSELSNFGYMASFPSVPNLPNPPTPLAGAHSPGTGFPVSTSSLPSTSTRSHESAPVPFTSGNRDDSQADLQQLQSLPASRTSDDPGSPGCCSGCCITS